MEPDGSTIFGGKPGPYISAGAGLQGPSGIVKTFGHVIDGGWHVADLVAQEERERFDHLEGISVGLTSGMALSVGMRLAAEMPHALVVVIAADGGESYLGLLSESTSCLVARKPEDGK